jgi:hypothetical protein
MNLTGLFVSSLISAAVLEHTDDEVFSLLQTKAAITNDVMHSDQSGNVLYVVKSYSGYYNTRLRAIMQTWGASVNRDSLIIVADEPSQEFTVHAFPECGNLPPKSLTCRVAAGLALASQHPGNWKWVVVVDDDHYVVTSQLESELANFESISGPVGIGAWGCGVPEYCDGKGGFCGGTGYGFNRAALQMLVKGSPDSFREAHKEMAALPKSGGREDMVTSCLALERVPNFDVKELESTVAEMTGETWADLNRKGKCRHDSIFHKANPEEIHRLHQIIAGPEKNCDEIA